MDTLIRDIMTQDVIVVEANDDLRDVVSTFNNHSIRHAPVRERGELVGMLSWIDLKKAPMHDGDGLIKSNGKLRASDMMTADPVSIQLDATIEEVAEILVENEFHALPVLDGSRIVGIVSTTDLIRYFLDNVSE